MNDFLSMLFPAIGQESRLSIFTLPSKASRLFASVNEAAEYAARCDGDVYHCMSLIGGNPSGRGERKDTVGIGSVWVDIDVSGTAHASKDLPSSKEEAIEFLDSLPEKATTLVDSGHGIHAYWILDNPITFMTEDGRAAAERLSKGWHGFICKQAAMRGWKLENLGDLPRVLRTPGTKNHKVPGDIRDVVVLRNTGETFSAGRLLAISYRDSEQKAAAVSHSSPSGNGNGRPLPFDRCLKYIETIPGAIQGSAGGTQTLVACRAIARFGLEGDTARAAFDAYNVKCVPPWESEKEINHKIVEGRKIVERDNEFGKWVNEDAAPYSDEIDLTKILTNATSPVSCEVPDDLPHSPASFPADCLRPPGLLAEIIDYNLATALFPQPELALAAAIALLGTITGRKVQDIRKTRTNVYCLGLALSGSGKEHARSINKEILLRATPETEQMIGPEGVASSAGLVSFVASRKTILFQLDEISRLLETMRDPKRNPHLYKIGTALMQLESNAHCIWTGEAYANQKQTPKINQPHACLYGTAVPRGFWESLTDDNVSEGLLGRMLVFETVGRYVDIQTPASIAIPDSLLEGVRWWSQRPYGLGNCSEENPTPYVVPHSKNASKRLEDHFKGICKRRNREDDARSALWSRTTGKTAKLALLFACSRETGHDAITIHTEDVERAIAVSNWLTRRMLYQAYRHVSRNDRESASKRILRLLAERMTKTDLTRKTQWLNRRQREEILGELIESGLVRLWQEDTGGKVKKTWIQTHE